MFLKSTDRSVRVVGVALEGRAGSPVVILEDGDSGALLPLPVDPFDAEILIREFSGESEVSSGAWLEELLRTTPPRRGKVAVGGGGRPVIRFLMGLSRRDRMLGIGEGLALCRRMDIAVTADESLFDAARDELDWLSATGAFFGDFLYLSPPQYAPGIPVE